MARAVDARTFRPATGVVCALLATLAPLSAHAQQNPFRGQWTCHLTPTLEPRLPTGERTALRHKLTINWRSKRLTVDSFAGAFKIVRSSSNERHIHGLLRDFVSLKYAYLRARFLNGAPRTGFYLSDATSLNLAEHGVADCVVQR